MSREHKGLTVTVPYIPYTGVEGIQYGLDRFSSEVMRIEMLFPDHQLTDIVGSHMSLIDGEWVQIGYNLKFTPELAQGKQAIKGGGV